MNIDTQPNWIATGNVPGFVELALRDHPPQNQKVIIARQAPLSFNLTPCQTARNKTGYSRTGAHA
ncbi:MAG: hypothetical protein ACREOO_32195 [bacterium]